MYSFFLLNVKATLENGVLYPAKAIWEDIEVAPFARGAMGGGARERAHGRRWPAHTGLDGARWL